MAIDAFSIFHPSSSYKLEVCALKIYSMKWIKGSYKIPKKKKTEKIMYMPFIITKLPMYT